ncbi:MAG: hypothetical protein WC635_02925 [Bacteriovorax sp.]
MKVVAFTVAFGAAKVLHLQMQQVYELFTTSLTKCASKGYEVLLFMIYWEFIDEFGLESFND